MYNIQIIGVVLAGKLKLWFALLSVGIDSLME